MSRDEVRFAEAVASLTARLDSWGVEDPHDKAHQYVADMRRQGWRPVSLPTYTPARPEAVPPPAEALALARAELAKARAATQQTGDHLTAQPARMAPRHEVTGNEESR